METNKTNEIDEDWKANALISINVEKKCKKVTFEMNREGIEFLIEELNILINEENPRNFCIEFDGDTYAHFGLLKKNSFGVILLRNDEIKKR